MNSGLYALAGASATATAAAWANRLLAPMTKVSKVYFGLSRVASTSVTLMESSGRGRRAPRFSSISDGAVEAGMAGARHGVAGERERLAVQARRRLGVVEVEGGVDRHGQAHVGSELGRQRPGDLVADPGLHDVLGEVVGHLDQGGSIEQAHEPRETEEGPLLCRDPVSVESREGVLPDLTVVQISICHWSHPWELVVSRCFGFVTDTPLWAVHTLIHNLWVSSVGAPTGTLTTRARAEQPDRRNSTRSSTEIFPYPGVSAVNRSLSAGSAHAPTVKRCWFDPVTGARVP